MGVPLLGEAVSRNEADRRLAAAVTLAQLDVIQDAFAAGQMQPLLHRNDGVVGDDFARHDAQIVGFTKVAAPNGAFVLHTQRKSPRYGEGRLSYEVDGTGEDFVFMIGPWEAYMPFRDMFNPVNVDARRAHLDKRQKTYSAGEFQDGALSFAEADVFTTLIRRAYKYTRRQLPKVPLQRTSD